MLPPVLSTGLAFWLRAFKLLYYKNYLLQTYIVTSKPKRISVAAGLVHIMLSFMMIKKITKFNRELCKSVVIVSPSTTNIEFKNNTKKPFKIKELIGKF